jgi:hypothetical protein
MSQWDAFTRKSHHACMLYASDRVVIKSQCAIHCVCALCMLLILYTCCASLTFHCADTTAAVSAATPSFAVNFDSFNSATTDSNATSTTDVTAKVPAASATVTVTTPATFDTNSWLAFDNPSTDTAQSTSFANFDTDTSSNATATAATAAATSSNVLDTTSGFQNKQYDTDTTTEPNDDSANDSTTKEQQQLKTLPVAAADSSDDTATANDNATADIDDTVLSSEPEVAVVKDTDIDTVHDDSTATVISDAAAAAITTITTESDATTADADSATMNSDAADTKPDEAATDASDNATTQQSDTDTAADHHVVSSYTDTTIDKPETTPAADHTNTAASTPTTAAVTESTVAPVALIISVLAKLSPAVTLAEVLANDTLSPVLSNNPRYVCISHIRHHTDESVSTSGSTTTISALEVFDLLKGQCNRYPITAAAAIMRPAVSDSEPRVIALYVKQDSSTNSSGRFNVFNMDSGARLRDQPMAAPLLLWRWLNSSVLVLVTHASVFHWDTSGHSRPVKAFDRQYTLPHAIATATSSDTTTAAAAARSRSASVSANSVCLKGYSCSGNSSVATSDWAMLLAVPAQHTTATTTATASSNNTSLTVDLHDFKHSATYKLRVLGACFSSIGSSSSSSSTTTPDTGDSESASDNTATTTVLTIVTTDVHDASKHVLKVLDLSKPPAADSIDSDSMCQGWCVLAEHQLTNSGSSGNYILLPLITATAAAAVVVVSRTGHVSVVSITKQQGFDTVQCTERVSVQACNGMTVIDASISSDSKHVVIATAATETQTCRVLKVALQDVL